MYCRKCGELLVDEARFCVHCGTAVTKRRIARVVIPVLLGLGFLMSAISFGKAALEVLESYLEQGVESLAQEGYEISQFGWAFYPPEGWELYTEEELQAEYGERARDNFRAEFAAYKEGDAGKVTVFTMEIPTEGLSNRLIAAAMYAADEEGNILMPGNLTQSGERVIAVNETVSIAGEEYGLVTLQSNDPDFGVERCTNYYVRAVSDVVCIIAHGYLPQDREDEELIRNSFSALDGNKNFLGKDLVESGSGL